MCTTSGEARARARVIVPRFTVEGPRSTFPETVAFRASHRGTYQIGKTCGVRMGAVYWRDMIHYTNDKAFYEVRKVRAPMCEV